MSKQLMLEWESWKPLIREDFEKAQHRIMCFHKSASVYCNKKERNELLEKELVELIKEVCNLN